MSDMQQSLISVGQGQLTKDDYYTPKWVFDTLGLTFDIDVCAPPGGVPWVPAARYFTLADDGLSQPWAGSVWMNPPFSDTAKWWRRFAEHANGVALLPMAKSEWIDDVWRRASAVTLPSQARTRRIDFVRPDKPDKPVEIWFPVFFAAFGDECVEALSRVGVVRVRAS